MLKSKFQSIMNRGLRLLNDFLFPFAKFVCYSAHVSRETDRKSDAHTLNGTKIQRKTAKIVNVYLCMQRNME